MGNANLQEVKLWLLRFREAEMDSSALDRRIVTLRERAMSLRGPRLDGMPHKPGFEGDNVGVALALISELETEAREARAHAISLFREIDAAIGRISGRGGSDRREVLRMRYLDGCRWPEISETLFGDRDDFEDRAESFLRRTHKIHNAALIELSKYVPLDEGQENESGMGDKK